MTGPGCEKPCPQMHWHIFTLAPPSAGGGARCSRHGAVHPLSWPGRAGQHDEDHDNDPHDECRRAYHDGIRLKPHRPWRRGTDAARHANNAAAAAKRPPRQQPSGPRGSSITSVSSRLQSAGLCQVCKLRLCIHSIHRWQGHCPKVLLFPHTHD